jgi:hypothetical protein
LTAAPFRALRPFVSFVFQTPLRAFRAFPPSAIPVPPQSVP